MLRVCFVEMCVLEAGCQQKHRYGFPSAETIQQALQLVCENGALASTRLGDVSSVVQCSHEALQKHNQMQFHVGKNESSSGSLDSAASCPPPETAQQARA